ncbi:MAG: M24 family metallopeptidase [bacterium]|nr:M24 family metallopeptidase [bacterium]
MNQNAPRTKKTVQQLKAIREVQRATESAMEAVISYLQSTKNPTSEEAHQLIDTILEKHNCESPEGHIVSGGIQSVEPHEVGTGPLKKGVPIVIDIYPRSKITGYFADMTRTVCIGTQSPELQKMYNAVLAAQELALSMIKPKIKCSNIQAAVDTLFKEKGYKTSGKGKVFKFAEGFVHGIGHGVGLDIHEAPRIGRGSTDILKKGDVITIEPALYYPKLGGIRLEDMVLVTSSGVENLTHFPKQFKIVTS